MQTEAVQAHRQHCDGVGSWKLKTANVSFRRAQNISLCLFQRYLVEIMLRLQYDAIGYSPVVLSLTVQKARSATTERGKLY